MSELASDFGGSNATENNTESGKNDKNAPSERMQAFETLKGLRSLCNKYVAKVDNSQEDYDDGRGEGARALANQLSDFLYEGHSLGDEVTGGMKQSNHRKEYGTGKRLTEAADVETRGLTDDERGALNADVDDDADERVGDGTWVLPEDAEIDPDNVEEMMDYLKEWADVPHYAEDADAEDADADDTPAVESDHKATCSGTTADGSPCGRAVENVGDTCWQHDAEDAEDADAESAEDAEDADAESANVEDIEPEILAKMSAEQINALN
jgi:hypothetical protein